MNQTAILHITDKGADEVSHRTYKLGIKLRSLLLLLSKPQSVQYAFQKSVFPKEETEEALGALLQQGFVELKDAPADKVSIQEPVAALEVSIPTLHTQNAPKATVAAAPAPTAPAAATRGDWDIDPEIILSEAKFLLIDFCVDCFGMQSEKLTEDIRGSKTVGAMRSLVKELLAMVSQHKPDQINAFRDTIRKVNETA